MRRINPRDLYLPRRKLKQLTKVAITHRWHETIRREVIGSFASFSTRVIVKSSDTVPAQWSTTFKSFKRRAGESQSSRPNRSFLRVCAERGSDRRVPHSTQPGRESAMLRNKPAIPARSANVLVTSGATSFRNQSVSGRASVSTKTTTSQRGSIAFIAAIRL